MKIWEFWREKKDFVFETQGRYIELDGSFYAYYGIGLLYVQYKSFGLVTSFLIVALRVLGCYLDIGSGL